MSARRSFKIIKAREALGVLEAFALAGQRGLSGELVSTAKTPTWGEAMTAIGVVDELLRAMLAESDRRAAAARRPKS